MIEGIENFNVQNAAHVLEKLKDFTTGRATANLMTRSCLAQRRTSPDADASAPPPPAEPDADNCVWCLEGVVAVAVDPDALEWRRRPGGALVMMYQDHGQHSIGPSRNSNADFLPKGWWIHHFGVPPAALTPPQTFQEPFWEAIERWRPKDRMAQMGRDVRLWELNDSIGPIAWDWTADHFRKLRDHWLPGGRPVQP